MQSSIVYCGKAKADDQEEGYSNIATTGMLMALLPPSLLSFVASITLKLAWKFGLLSASGTYIFSVLFQESPDEGGWHDLVAKGYIEYIDTEEEETTMISMTINVRSQQRSSYSNSFC